jgi:hypothetical protein
MVTAVGLIAQESRHASDGYQAHSRQPVDFPVGQIAPMEQAAHVPTFCHGRYFRRRAEIAEEIFHVPDVRNRQKRFTEFPEKSFSHIHLSYRNSTLLHLRKKIPCKKLHFSCQNFVTGMV